VLLAIVVRAPVKVNVAVALVPCIWSCSPCHLGVSWIAAGLQVYLRDTSQSAGDPFDFLVLDDTDFLSMKRLPDGRSSSPA